MRLIGQLLVVRRQSSVAGRQLFYLLHKLRLHIFNSLPMNREQLTTGD
ncbi:MAG: hypothetical protein QOG71_2716 [Pyrinomonadaceae bacterium]|nr:hypothetical protein [Pyrinomonadaceae bacterium]